MTTMLRAALFLTLSLCALATSPPAFAAAKTSPHPDLTVAPAITEWTIKPGTTQSKTVQIFNSGKQPMPISAVAQNFVVEEQIKQEDRHLFDASNWFTIQDPDFILPPGGTHKTTVTLRAPRDAEPGGHYATIYFRQLAVRTSNTHSTQTIGRVGMLAFVVVQGAIQKQVEAPQPVRLVKQKDGHAFALTLRNTGNVHVLPRGHILIKNWRGDVIDKVPISTGVLLPKTERTYTARWDHIPTIGRLGAEAMVSYGEQHQVVEHTGAVFWLLPGRILTLLLFAGCVGWFGIFRIRHRWMRVWKELRRRES